MAKKLERVFKRGNDGNFYCKKDSTGEYVPGERVDEEVIKKLWSEQLGFGNIDLSWVEEVMRF